MYSFTVGSIAAIINAVVAILQFVLPNALVLTLVATLSDTHTAVTWSVVARSIQSSHWPLLLRSDSAVTKHDRLSSTIITLLRPIALTLVAIAAIVTPLGLYEDIQPSAEPRRVDFVRQPDKGPFGLLTPPRSDLGFSRQCSDGGGLLGQCPGTTTVIKYSNDGDTFNATIVNDDYDRRIPARLAELYQSGLSELDQPASVSSFFDIEWRWYNKHTRDNMLNHSYLVDSYHPITSVIGQSDIQLIEGLIVDIRDGGVGFRSHTVPATSDLLYGAEWSEDVLFFQPETACVDTNVTLEYAVPSEDEFFGRPTQNIVDQGGFAQISRQNPWDDGWYGDTQQDPKLRARAYRAAWTMNVLNMFFFNVTEPHTNLSTIGSFIGRKFSVNNTLDLYAQQSAGLTSLATLSLDPYNGLTDVPLTPYTYLNGSLVSNETYLSGSSSETSWPNPYDISTDNYTAADQGCSAFAGGDWANLTNIQVKCGLVLGPANKTRGSDTPLVEPGSVWTRPVYMCSSATKAIIKTVRFSFNRTQGSGLEGLAVISIKDKQYEGKGEMPIWGIETPNMTLDSITPFWGLVDTQMVHSVNLSTVQADHLYIPASASSVFNNLLNMDGGTDYMPGTAAPAVIWESAYARQDSSGLQDLSGRTSLALASMWKNMTMTATGTASIMDLIWTDLAANALIGTRGWLSSRNALPPNLQGSLRKRDETMARRSSLNGQVPVYVYQRMVRYRWVYGIPAALCLLLAAIICVAAIVAVTSGKSSIPWIRYYLNRLSAGRLLAALKVGEHDYDSDTKVWLAADGRRRLSLPVSGPVLGTVSGYESVSTDEQHVVEPKYDIHASPAGIRNRHDRR
ncbi:hypothetical protein LTR37_011617 [Vermiconidia calcicola]|uniref:Uncharacterized protein n=1 Tax=Vermiconidia calcicola TaxID=1690605 RepID=A0ACC3N1L3_9PEZI|nr:hypothetical protein LTR37_011617 [Vermiconidia calcicola]